MVPLALPRFWLYCWSNSFAFCSGVAFRSYGLLFRSSVLRRNPMSALRQFLDVVLLVGGVPLGAIDGEARLVVTQPEIERLGEYPESIPRVTLRREVCGAHDLRAA